MLATPNVPILLSVLASDGNTGLYARARVYDSSNAFIDQAPLTNVVEGLYQSQYTFIAEGMYTVVYQFFLDAGFLIPAIYDKAVETVDCSSERTNVMRILGLVHDNSVVDQQVFNGSNQLLSARIRNYNSKTNADLAGATGLLFTWFLTASYSGLNLINFKITRDV